MAVPSVRDVETGDSGFAETVTVNAPAHSVAGDHPDVLVAFLETRSLTPTWVVPSGWTVIEDLPHATNGQFSAAVATKIATDSEPASYDFESTGSFIIATVLSVQDSPGLVGSSMAADNSLNATADSPSVTPTAAGNLLLRGWYGQHNGSVTPFFSHPGGHTNHAEVRNSSTRLSTIVASLSAPDTSPTGIVQANTWSNSGKTTASNQHTIGTILEFEHDPTVFIEARLELGLDAQSHVFTTTMIDARLELGLAADADMATLIEARLELGLASLAEGVTIVHTIEARLELGLSATSSLALEHFLNARLELGLDAREDPLGPGYGLVTPRRGSGGGVGSGAGFDIFHDPTAELREGDEFLAFLPGHGLSGVVGIARVVSRSSSDEDRRQRIDTIQFTPIDDETYIPRLSTGDQIRMRISESIQHSFNRFRRRVQRERRLDR